MSSSAPVSASSFDQLDDVRPNKFQMKIMLVSGMGFFTDAYDLFVIGIVVKIVATQWHLSTTQVSLLSSLTLAGSAVGAILFGRIADMFGRKKMYGVEVLLLAAGAIASAFSPNITWLIIFRVILGIGIGGDYPVSATIMSEYSGKKSRGQMVGMVFSMQAAGLIVGPLIAVLLLSVGIKDDIVWRILLGIGAIPGLAVFYLRRQIHETPRFAMAGGDAVEAQAAIAEATGVTAAAARAAATESRPKAAVSLTSGWIRLLTNRTLLKWLAGASIAWFMMDFAYYGNTIASPEIIGLIDSKATLIQGTLIQLAIFSVFALPGYFVAIYTIERLGRKQIQIFGFAVMAIMFALIGLVPGISTAVAPFVIVFGISYFFTEFGPNTTTFIYPAEIFPTEARTSGHGIAAAVGKMGGFAGTFLFPDMLAAWGIRGAEGIAAGCAVLGLMATFAFLPEPRGKSLEELEQEADQAPIASFQPATA